MRNYEVTFLVDPVLSGEEIKATAQNYVEQLKSHGAKIVHNDEMGLRQLAYPINKRTSAVYYSVQVEVPNGEFVSKIELAMRRDERIMRFLCFSLNKYGVKYNEDKRAGKIGKKRPKAEAEGDVPKGVTKTLGKPKKTPVKPEAIKTQSKMSESKATVTKVAGEEEE